MILWFFFSLCFSCFSPVFFPFSLFPLLYFLFPFFILFSLFFSFFSPFPFFFFSFSLFSFPPSTPPPDFDQAGGGDGIDLRISGQLGVPHSED